MAPLKRFRRILGALSKIILIVAAALIILPLLSRLATTLIFQRDHYTAQTVAPRRVAMVFGARIYTLDRPSAMLADRVATGVDLYKAGKVEILLMTGDNSMADYNEPEAMRRYAVRLGVPNEAIVLDYAGRRTYDSCYRAKHIFQLDEAIVVSQAFHLDRILLTCDALGVKALGVAADYQRPNGYSRASMTYSTAREFPATLVAMIDLIARPLPILGDPLPIFPEDRLEEG